MLSSCKVFDGDGSTTLPDGICACSGSRFGRCLCFDKNYSDATAEYLKDIKKGRVYGSLRAWKNGAQYIVLEQDEPGYHAEDMSLSRSVGSKQGMIISNTDLNTCR
ncbi:hypothetical protein MKD49_13725 [Herbaspirillum sp. WGmk3]|uniref:hypothetical protein n=1 Tax=Herbaspirillum sp. WGmk3 TaxID=2919925 RepID=UPI002090F3B2|nr:hypothetical protein [Herbaspirillum sp. WGmk3]MCO4857541.1 hypothetical protein [Herbaspirillum sp. WGmk3]